MSCNQNMKVQKISAIQYHNRIVVNDSSELYLIFAGDIMQHQLQLDGALNPVDSSYDFSTQFKYLSAYFKKADAVIANLEVTFGGKPYMGYPEFSSPEQLAEDLKDAGISYLLTANNHIYDRGKKGFENTLKTLDKNGISRTGTYLNPSDKRDNHPMIITKNNFRIAIYNYTYDINGDYYNEPNIIEKIDTSKIRIDLQTAKSKQFDAIILMLHWGEEYERHPTLEQEQIADFCFKHGADYIIGSHPHVIQRIEWFKDPHYRKDKLIAYSLGNYVSNYGTWRYCDGGALLHLKLVKKAKQVKIKDAKYQLIWVYRPYEKGKRRFYVIPVNEWESNQKLKGMHKSLFQRFVKDSRELLKTYNKNIFEFNSNTNIL